MEFLKTPSPLATTMYGDIHQNFLKFLKKCVLWLAQSLPLMPSLQHLLVLEGSCTPLGSFTLNDAFLQELTPTKERPVPLLPNLESLAIYRCQAISDRVLVDSMKARYVTQSSGPFRSISVMYDRGPADDIIHELKYLECQGLEVKVFFDYETNVFAEPREGLMTSNTWFQTVDTIKYGDRDL
jgi:hypothetical protein